MNDIDIRKSLAEIVGDDYVSNQAEYLYFYARDLGLEPPGEPEYVVAPKTTGEVQNIVELANKEKIPIVPMGGGLAITGLVIPLKGGIVLDMKRMDKILELNEKARYVIFEAGTSHGKLKAYLERNYPHLRHSLPDAPPAVTIAGNVAIHGQGHLAQQYGFNSDMVTGLEVVLPTGEVCKIGSCSMSPYWFSKGPTLPDLSGLFLGWLGTTGIITKLGMKLYPCKNMKDLEIFVTDKPDLIPDIVYKITHTEMIEDINVWFQEKPIMFRGNYHVTIFFTGDTDEEIEFKRKMIWDALREIRDNRDGGFMWVVPSAKSSFLEMPSTAGARMADVKKGGGMIYSGPILLFEKYPAMAKKLKEIVTKYELAYFCMARVIGRSHCMMFGLGFLYNRADSDMMDRVRKALREATEFAFDQGAISWKPSVWEQKMVMERMDPNTLNLMKKIKGNLDPNGIMNPGNWEVI